MNNKEFWNQKIRNIKIRVNSIEERIEEALKEKDALYEDIWIDCTVVGICELKRELDTMLDKLGVVPAGGKKA